MSVWNDIRKKSLGIEERIENKKVVFFRIYSPHKFEMYEKIVIKNNLGKVCEGECIGQSRISNEPLFKLTGGNHLDLVQPFEYSVGGETYRSAGVYLVEPLNF